jgi:hypothetical protein
VSVNERSTTSAARRIATILTPLEIVALCGAIMGVAATVFFGVRFYIPSGNSALFATEHYVLPLGLAMLVSLLVHSRRSRVKRADEVVESARALVAFAFVLYLHFNLKLWAQLINSERWDAVLQKCDEWLSPAITVINFLHLPFDGLVGWWPGAYHAVFVGMFIVSLVAHAAVQRDDRSLSEVATAIAILLVAGGCAYALAPAWGPFVFMQGTNEEAAWIQATMETFQGPFVSSGGTEYRGDNFIMALGAMPSLHVGHSFILLCYAWWRLRWLAYLYMPLFLFIVTEAIVAKWHYLLDIPAGLAFAGLSIWLARMLHRQPIVARPLSG